MEYERVVRSELFRFDVIPANRYFAREMAGALVPMKDRSRRELQCAYGFVNEESINDFV
jgi:hypothetical protein